MFHTWRVWDTKNVHWGKSCQRWAWQLETVRPNWWAKTKFTSSVQRQFKKGGPERARDSRIKFPCYYKHCRWRKDVKNVGKTLRLPKEEANLEECNKVRATCHVLRICCQKHRAKCKKTKIERLQSMGSGASPDHLQIVRLYQVLLDLEPWSTVLRLLQLCIGKRSGAARQCRSDWIRGHDPKNQHGPTTERTTLLSTLRRQCMLGMSSMCFHHFLEPSKELLVGDGH